MAAWTQDIALASPGALAGLISDFEDLVTAADGMLDGAADALDAAKLLLTGTAAPMAAAALASATTARGIIGDIFGAGVYPITVHPWQPGVGHGHAPEKVSAASVAGSNVAFNASDLLTVSLSFPNARRAIIDSFDDRGDANRPQFSNAAEVSMIVMIAGAPSPVIFQQVIQAVRALVDIPPFRLAQRRIEQAIRQGKDQFTRPTGSRLPDWDPPTNVLSVFPGLRPLYEALDSAAATLEGYARGGVAAVDFAADLITQKRAQLTVLKARLDAAALLFAGGLEGAGFWKVRIDGVGGNTFLKNELAAATGAPGHELSLCVGSAWVASPAELAGVASILGL